MDPISDKALMLKVKDGDLDRLGLIFERYHRRLYRYFYGLTLQQQTSEDLVQEVFERMLKYRHSYTGEGRFSTWIYQIARNRHSDYYRDNQRKPETNVAIESEMIPGDDEMIAEPETERNKMFLQQAIEKLDPIKKETLVLSRYQGLTYPAIAEIMDCSVSAVKVRIYRTLQELRVMINKLKDESL